jgi:hypothetical protein
VGVNCELGEGSVNVYILLEGRAFFDTFNVY